MSYLHMEYLSTSLQMNTGINIVLPDEGSLADAKTVYLLHGLSDNASGWSRFTSCERYARERNLILILPEVQRSFYTDCAFGPSYFQYVSQELPNAMRRIFGLSLAREKNYIMGLSMGGYGALKCALTFPERYTGVASFSAVTDLEDFFRISQSVSQHEITGILGLNHKEKNEDNLFDIVRHGKDFPQIYMSCGEQDALYCENFRFHQTLICNGIDHTFDHRPGNHTWDFWDQSLQDAFSCFFH